MARVLNATRQTVLASQAVLATGFWLRLRGLMFRRRFGPFDGLWLAPTNAIHMFWVFFPIDLVWLDHERRVLRCTRGLKPWRVEVVAGARSVLELPVGAVTRSGTVPGDQVVFEDSERSVR
ncbi:MAG: DUF192 domain-containing protein [Armatimonadetes bacterium]|nr:DUF192 domain-containing protein [Armatimonadota bacterium]